MQEKIPENIDFLSENINLGVRISRSSIEDFPIISDRDMHTKEEKLLFILGSWNNRDSTHLDISIEGVFDCPEALVHRPGEITVDYQKAETIFDSLKKENEESLSLSLLGNVHTHPYTEEELKRHPATPTSHDIEGWKMEAVDSLEQRKIPQVFGIVSRNEENGSMQLALYHIVKGRDGTFYHKPIKDWEYGE